MSKPGSSTTPALTYDPYTDFWRDAIDNGWACHSQLESLFHIKQSDVIRLFSSKRSRSDTYEIHTIDGNPDHFALPEIEDEVYVVFDLRQWLCEQVAAGRFHIGVEILSGRTRLASK